MLRWLVMLPAGLSVMLIKTAMSGMLRAILLAKLMPTAGYLIKTARFWEAWTKCLSKRPASLMTKTAMSSVMSTKTAMSLILMEMSSARCFPTALLLTKTVKLSAGQVSMSGWPVTKTVMSSVMLMKTERFAISTAISSARRFPTAPSLTTTAMSSAGLTAAI